MGISTELTFTIVLMLLAGIILFLFIIKHMKKLAIIIGALIVCLGIRTGQLGYMQHAYNLALEKAGELKDRGSELTTDIKDNVDEHVDLPDAHDVRFFHYYEVDGPGYGIPSEDEMVQIQDKAEEIFGE